MPALGRPTLNQLAWPWVSSTVMAAAGMTLHYLNPEVWMVVYGLSPLMAVLFLLCMMHLWPKKPWLTILLMLAVCYSAQWGFIKSGLAPARVILVGAISAMLTGFISAKIGSHLRSSVFTYLLLAGAGGFSMWLILQTQLLGHVAIVLAVWLWQFTVGSILVAMAQQTPVPQEHNMRVLLK
jgi:hypothetical protein